MKKLSLITMLCTLLLVACNNESEQSSGALMKKDALVEEVQKEKVDTRIKIPLADVKDSAVFTTTMQSQGTSVNIYIVPITKTVEFVEYSSAFSQEGDIVSEGKYSFFIESIGEDFAVLADDFKEVPLTINLKDMPFKTYKFNNYTLLSYQETEASIARSYKMWLYKDAKLQPVLVDGNDVFSSTSGLRFIDDNYMQKYDYYNAEPFGWIYHTYEWNEDTNNFVLINETEYVDENWDTGSYLSEEWNEDEKFTNTFPRYDLVDSIDVLAKQGKLLEDWPALNSSLDDLLVSRPEFIGTGSYSYANGIDFSGESTISMIYLDGKALLPSNTMNAFLDALGVPDSENYGGGSMAYRDNVYDYGTHELIITDNLDDRVLAITVQTK